VSHQLLVGFNFEDYICRENSQQTAKINYLFHGSIC